MKLDQKGTHVYYLYTDYIVGVFFKGVCMYPKGLFINRFNEHSTGEPQCIEETNE